MYLKIKLIITIIILQATLIILSPLVLPLNPPDIAGWKAVECLGGDGEFSLPATVTNADVDRFKLRSAIFDEGGTGRAGIGLIGFMDLFIPISDELSPVTGNFTGDSSRKTDIRQSFICLLSSNLAAP